MDSSHPQQTLGRASLPELRLVGTVLTPEEELPRGLLVARDGKILSLEPWPGEAPSGALEIDGWIAPGFIDLQVNGFGSQDFADPGADVALASQRLAEHGVTAFLPTLITSPRSLYLERVPRLEGPLPAAQSLGVHLEGPYLSPEHRGAHPERYLRLPDMAELDELLTVGPVRLMTLAPEVAGAVEAVQRLARSNVAASLGHSGATFEQAQRALDAGATAGTHLFNAMRPLRHREPGLPGALLVDQRATVGIIADGVHLHWAIVQLAYLTKGAERLALVTDAISAAGMPPGVYRLGELKIQVRAGQARLADGTLAGSVLTMDAAVRNVVEHIGCSLRDAIVMATVTPARLLGLSTKGRICPGADADLVVLSRTLEVERTYVGGRLVAVRRGDSVGDLYGPLREPAEGEP